MISTCAKNELFHHAKLLRTIDQRVLIIRSKSFKDKLFYRALKGVQLASYSSAFFTFSYFLKGRSLLGFLWAHKIFFVLWSEGSKKVLTERVPSEILNGCERATITRADFQGVSFFKGPCSSMGSTPKARQHLGTSEKKNAVHTQLCG